MSPIFGVLIAAITIALCLCLSPDAKPKPQSDAQKLEALLKKMAKGDAK